MMESDGKSGHLFDALNDAFEVFVFSSGYDFYTLSKTQSSMHVGQCSSDFTNLKVEILLNNTY